MQNGLMNADAPKVAYLGKMLPAICCVYFDQLLG